MLQNVTKLAPKDDRVTFAKLKITKDEEIEFGFNKKRQIKSHEA